MKQILNYLKASLFSLIAVVAFATAPASAWVADNVTPENLGTIEVDINDLATGGCWTNLGEVKTYAADKLAEVGFEVVENSRALFIIIVHSERAANDLCYGRIDTSIGVAVSHNGMFGGLEVGSEGSIFSNYRNANTLTLDVVREQIEQLEDAQPDR